MLPTPFIPSTAFHVQFRQMFSLVSVYNFDTEAPNRVIETTSKNCDFAGVQMHKFL